MIGPSEGVTTESPIETISKRKKDSELRAALSAATVPIISTDTASWMALEKRTDKQESHGTGTASVLVDVSVVAKVGEHLHDQKDDGARNVVLQARVSGSREDTLIS